MSTPLAQYLARQGKVVPGLERSSGDGRDLGERFEVYIKHQLAAARMAAHRAGLPLLQDNWTQPRFRWGGHRRGWQPCGKGWVDLNLFLPSGASLQVDLKAVDMGASRHARRWVLDKKLRRDREEGHQIATLDALTALGHRAGVLLGRYWPDRRRQPWDLYLVPVSVDFGRPSIPWEEVEPYRVTNNLNWWEA